jgi:ABC-type multidrug transport system fused ATPase/permease subunit
MFLARYGLTLLTQYVGQRVMLDLRTQLYDRLTCFAPRFFDTNPVGRLVTRVTNDVQTLAELLTSGVFMIFSDLFLLLGITAYLLILDWRLALVAFSVLPLLFVISAVFKTKVRAAFRDVRLRLARINAFLQEAITGVFTIQIFDRAERMQRRFREINQAHTEANMRSVLYFSVYYPAVELVNAAAIALILWYGGGRALDSALTFGVLFAFIRAANKFFEPIRDLTEKYNVMQTAMAAAERLFKLLDSDARLPLARPARRIERFEREIEFDRVRFAYRGSEDVLHELSFKVKKGEKVAIVGHTGAGKTTMIHLLARFYDVREGAIRIDGIDLRELELADLRRLVRIVPQDVFLFTGDIARNIRLGEQAIDQPAIERAAREAQADPFIRRLPGGYAAPVVERGATLSVGQKQLLSFSRALAFDPQILVLDEATSSVDTETEALIQEALRHLLAGRTAIVIAHRLSTVREVDRIYVLHQGRLREQGSHQELLARRGLYYRLYLLQSADRELSGSGAARAAGAAAP